MQNFIVLGIIPGTDIQTTFTFWLMVAIGFCALVSLPFVFGAVRRLRAFIVAYRIARTIEQFELIAL